MGGRGVMLYLITTYPDVHAANVGMWYDERLYVATLNDAQEYVDQIDYHYEVPESGGTISLPGGTVIEVEQIELGGPNGFDERCEALGIDTAGLTTAEQCDAYNETQES